MIINRIALEQLITNEYYYGNPLVGKIKTLADEITKLKKQLEKQQNDKENIIVTNKYNNYIEKYKVSDKDLILILLDIIISNNKNINDINDIYLHKYYIFITHPLNYDVSKMIKYIIYQENYLK